jgi:hypothetical protein
MLSDELQRLHGAYCAAGSELAREGARAEFNIFVLQNAEAIVKAVRDHDASNYDAEMSDGRRIRAETQAREFQEECARLQQRNQTLERQLARARDASDPFT